MTNFFHGKRLSSAVALALLSGLPAAQATAPFRMVPADRVVESSSVGRYQITFVEKGLLYYRGDVANLAATAPEASASRKLDSHSADAVAYAAWLSERRAGHIAAIEALLGRTLSIPHSYGIGRNAISVELEPDEANRLLNLDGIIAVEPVQVLGMETFRAPTFVGAATLWDGSNAPAGASATLGQGMKIGVLDAGANVGHPSFANMASCGFSVANPKIVAKDCLTSVAGVCTGTNPAAASGHGVHTSSTAAGNSLDGTASPAPILSPGAHMSGVAPCAAVTSYKVCDASTCSDDAIAAGIENAIIDQMDVANYSIGPTCGVGDAPWGNPDRRFLDAVAADVFIAAAAGNTRAVCVSPYGRVSNLGPWVMTVAASTQDFSASSEFQVIGPGVPPVELQHIPANAGTTTQIGNTLDLLNRPMRVYAANITGCTATGAFPPFYFRDGIAVVRRGTCVFAEKVNNAQAAGAQLVIVTNNVAVPLPSMDTTGSTLPSFIIRDLAVGDSLIAFVTAHLGTIPDPLSLFTQGFEATPAFDGTSGNYLRAALNPGQGDVLAGFSLRGPTAGNYSDLTKPDITAPGVSIYAAGRTEEGNYYLDSGTSMSSPVVAGAAVLVRKLQPSWTVSEVKSALQTTAFNGGFKEDGVTPWSPDEVGSGRVDLTRAAKAGLTLDETPANYLAANPDGGTVLIKNLNLASIRNVACGTPCSWVRVVKNRLPVSATWNVTRTAPAGYTLSVTPTTFTLAPGASQTLAITATPPVGSQAAVAFGDVLLTETTAQSPVQRLTVAVLKYVDPTPAGALDAAQAAIDFDLSHLPVVIKPAPVR